MKRIALINAVGLSQRLLGSSATPFLNEFITSTGVSTIKPAIPAVTCTAQSTYLTGTAPKEHGIVANGWYFKDEAVKLWRQSTSLSVARNLGAYAGKSRFTCANSFWWYNMYSSVDYSVTPCPITYQWS